VAFRHAISLADKGEHEVASIADSREHQLFPVLNATQIEAARRFASGPPRDFQPGETLYAIGEHNANAWLVLRGSIDAFRRDGLSGEQLITTHRAGQMTGEVHQLSGRAAIATGRAGAEGCTAVPFDAAHLRALMIGSVDVGEVVMRALILRRVALIEGQRAGTILIGAPNRADLLRLQVFLTRSGYPNLVLDAASDVEGRAFVDRIGVLSDELPLAVCPNGAVLKRPTEAELAACLGITPPLDSEKVYDVAIVGAGPAGLAAAVYGASEGLSVIVLESRATGGQAGASARIENYLGFPTGISGQALTGRAVSQALKFGAEIIVPVRVERFDCSDGRLTLSVSGNRRVRARTVVIASGAEYRRPDIAGLSAFEGGGMSYWASPIEARLCAGEEVGLVGGGNSAGQAIVFLAGHVKRLHVFVRRDLSETMSRYLIDRIAALANVELHIGCEIVGLEGNCAAGLEAATFRNRANGTVKRRLLRHLFLFIGADPHTAWLRDCIETDDKGFVLTGRSGQPLETNVPGVFAIGDVRAGSTKRVAAAVGEGAAVIAQIHQALAKLRAAGA
jgi:thioredoxin reductase (NADPH)